MTARDRAEALAREAHHAPVIATDCPRCVADIAAAIESAVAEARAEELARVLAKLADRNFHVAVQSATFNVGTSAGAHCIAARDLLTKGPTDAN